LSGQVFLAACLSGGIFFPVLILGVIILILACIIKKRTACPAEEAG